MDTHLPDYFSGKELSDLGIEMAPSLSEEELLILLARRIGQLMQQSMETFFQAMYRLDIPEAALLQGMADENPDRAIAEIVLRRQKMKLKSRSEHTGRPGLQDDELRW